MIVSDPPDLCSLGRWCHLGDLRHLQGRAPLDQWPAGRIWVPSGLICLLDDWPWSAYLDVGGAYGLCWVHDSRGRRSGGYWPALECVYWGRCWCAYQLTAMVDGLPSRLVDGAVVGHQWRKEGAATASRHDGGWQLG